MKQFALLSLGRESCTCLSLSHPQKCCGEDLCCFRVNCGVLLLLSATVVTAPECLHMLPRHLSSPVKETERRKTFPALDGNAHPILSHCGSAAGSPGHAVTLSNFLRAVVLWSRYLHITLFCVILNGVFAGKKL